MVERPTFLRSSAERAEFAKADRRKRRTVREIPLTPNRQASDGARELTSFATNEIDSHRNEGAAEIRVGQLVAFCGKVEARVRHFALCNYVGSCRAPVAEVVPPLAAAYATAPSIQLLALIVVGVPQAEIGALRLPGGRFLLCYAIWKNAQDDRASRNWHARLVAELEPMATGRYVGEADLAGGAGRIAGCYSAETWRRLLDLRQRYDPGRVFCSFPG
jgi:FAD/FMN-containing dehydrogenase